ncbi:hypothetical protein [Faecalibacter sp. LW9]|uniref:hypothetical protein n=1 Tax=Faecalibacter sp. LW9 TaxID=3103144 RepID=UPI002AFF7BD7|nr:hypothetical protein [Faecalibacter sp. LW9]
MNRYYTELRKEVTDRIKDGRTKFFTSASEAEQYARQKRSYHYQVFDINKQHVGWGVPK